MSLISGKIIELTFFSVDLIGEFLQQNWHRHEIVQFYWIGKGYAPPLVFFKCKGATGMLNSCSLFLNENIVSFDTFTGALIVFLTHSSIE